MSHAEQQGFHDLDLPEEDADTVRGGINGESADKDHKKDIQVSPWSLNAPANARPQAARR